MSQPQPQPQPLPLPRRKRPFTEQIESKLTTPVEVTPMPGPPGQPCTVRFDWCSVYFLTEHHLIGGEKTRKVEHNDELEGFERQVAHPVPGGPAVFQSKTACRGAIRQLLTEVLPPLLQHNAAHTAEHVPVPDGLVDGIVNGAAAGGGSYACVVRMHVEVTRVYSEAEELLLLCAAAPSSSESARRRAPPGANDDVACPICMDELAAGGVVAALRDCSHAFHRECVLEWFRKKPNCPCCRRDMMHHLDLSQPPALTMAAAIALAAAAETSPSSSSPSSLEEEREALSSSENAAVARANPTGLGATLLALRRRQRRAGPYVGVGYVEAVQRGVLLQRLEFQG